MNIKQTIGLSILGLGIFSVGAANYRLTTEPSNSKEKSAFNPANFAYWTNLDTETVATEALGAEDVCWIYTKTVTFDSFYTTFPGKELHIGSEDGTKRGTVLVRGNFACNDLRWHAGLMQSNTGGSTYKVSGSQVMVDTTALHAMGFSTITPSSDGWAWGFQSSLVCSSEDTTLTIYLTDTATTDATKKGTETRIDAQCFLEGDNSAFKGKMLVRNFGTLALGHANAAGDPETPRADAIELAANSRFAVQRDLELNAARGITITGEGVQFHARTYSKGITDTRSFKLAMPIVGAYGFTKMGSGRTTIAGSYTAGDIDVAQGKLVFAKTAAVKPDLTVTVRSGASFVQQGYIKRLNVVCEPGSIYSNQWNIAVAYADGVTTPADFEALDLDVADAPFPMALSEAIDVPFHETKRLDMLKLPVDTTLTAADFRDVSPKTYGLPNTTFEIEDREDGKMLVLVAKPVVSSQCNFSNTSAGLHGAATNWSDNAVSHAGADYLVLHSIDGLKGAFKGDSVTLSPLVGSPNLRSSISCLGKARVYTGTSFRPNSGGVDIFSFDSKSSIETVEDDSGKSVYFYTIYASGGKRQMRMRVNIPLSGSAPVVFWTSDNRAREIDAFADNSSFSGRVTVVATSASGQAAPSADDSTIFSIDRPEALGGPLAAPMADALWIKNYSVVNITNSMTLATTNRGITIIDGGFQIAEGQTLTVQQPIKVESTLLKKGAGMLALGGDLTAVNGATFQVLEGRVKPLADVAVANLPTTFAADTEIVLTPSDNLVNGFTGTLTLPEAGTVRVSADCLPPEEGTTEIPLCTVPADTPDLSVKFTLVPVPQRKATLVKTAVTVNEVECTRYSVSYGPAGFMVIIR